MGFLDKLKQAKNFITGGGADVSINFDSDTVGLGETLKITIMVAVKDADLNMDKAYIKVRSTEKVSVTDRDFDDGRTRTEQVRDSVKTWEQEIALEDVGAQKLEANQSYTWEGEVEIPDHVEPSYRGKNAQHKYEIFVGLDVPGNDPDSGWQPFTVR